jgi:UDP-N-acetyl-D-mannosaminouronate:lipid I N-acetyl-D-mannosaminouronosyltransferase
MNSKYINNIKIFAPECSEELVEFAFEKKLMLIAMNAEKILKSNDFEKKIMNENIAYPDGIGAVWSLKKKGLNKTVKIAGCELWLEIIKLKEKDKKFYLVGGKQEVIESTVNKLKSEYTNLDIVNYRNGYIQTEEEIIQLEEDILNKKPDVIFVAMGSPKQEILMSRLQVKHAAVYQGLGGSFDLYIGNVKRAPQWWMKIFKWEGLYRSLSDFTNIERWKRQRIVFRFIWKLCTNQI